jgi:serine protein kinase
MDEEIKIYEKLISQANFGKCHIAPHTLRCAAMLAVLSRLKESNNHSLTLLKKMRLYNGEDVEGFTAAEADKFRKEFVSEGMNGISPRYVINRLSSELAGDKNFITPIDIIRSLRDGLESNPKIDQQEATRIENLLTLIIEEYNKMARNDVQKAFFVNFEQEIGNLLKNYLDQVEAYLDGHKIENEWGNKVDPDERLMRSVEEKIQISESGKSSFRQEIYRKMLRSLKEHGEYRYQDHPRLKEALEKQLFDERQDIIRLTVSARNPDEEELKRVNGVVKVLCEKHGYTASSANQLLRYVSSLMARN